MPRLDPERRMGLVIFWISVLSLYLELLLIRWIGTEIRIFAYLQKAKPLASSAFAVEAGDRSRTGDLQLGRTTLAGTYRRLRSD